MTTVVVHAIPLNVFELTCSPINSRSLISLSMKMRTNGSSTPLITWDRYMISISGARG